MDDRFEFSTYRTLEEWEETQREREKFNREFEEKYRNDPELKFWSAGGGADL